MRRNDTTNWNGGNTAEILPAVAALKPIRTAKEVGKILNISRSAVFYIEKTALTKIVRTLRKIDK
jgi:hypothetical protein